MHVELTNVELEQFIDSQVRSGRFGSIEAAIESAIEQMRITSEALDEETIAAIAQADAQYEAGDFVEWQSVREQMRKKYLGK